MSAQAIRLDAAWIALTSETPAKQLVWHVTSLGEQASAQLRTFAQSGEALHAEVSLGHWAALHAWHAVLMPGAVPPPPPGGVTVPPQAQIGNRANAHL
jgi:hypothetical protein